MSCVRLVFIVTWSNVTHQEENILPLSYFPSWVSILILTELLVCGQSFVGFILYQFIFILPVIVGLRPGCPETISFAICVLF